MGRGWSWLDQARALRDAARRLHMPTVAQARLSTIQRTIARWENEAVRPGERYQLLLAHVHADQGGTTALGPGSDFDQLMTVFAMYSIEAPRISELRDLVTDALTSGTSGLLAFLSPNLMASLMPALADPRRADDESPTRRVRSGSHGTSYSEASSSPIRRWRVSVSTSSRLPSSSSTSAWT
jgi:hypothetical protein